MPGAGRFQRRGPVSSAPAIGTAFTHCVWSALTCSTLRHEPSDEVLMAGAHRRRTATEFNSLSLAAAARYLGVSRPTVYAWIAAGRLHAHRLGTRTRVLLDDAERLKQERTRDRNC